MTFNNLIQNKESKNDSLELQFCSQLQTCYLRAFTWICGIEFETKLKIDTSKIWNGFVPYHIAIHLNWTDFSDMFWFNDSLGKMMPLLLVCTLLCSR